ncbi:hypothetical protein [Paenibacillus agri]|uniref:Uncharacterized protein n=1 Tax=Paenibacillus agri TaxID=2744309 RepID=A0A850EE58_9BACL|nr:hypothetical protein [Paenibacillus agri]NUU59475.1 hypothetical protein [Paenibacillus agri]
MEQQVQQLSDWLNTQVNKTILIEKQELSDTDTIHFKLEGVDYRDADDVIDDYLDSALILRGSGSTLNRDGELVRLPQANYEIAVSGLRLNHSDAEAAEVQTDRAHYTLSKE